MKVKIHVLIAPDGSWNASGYGCPGEDEPTREEMRWISDGMPEHVSLPDCHWVVVEADVPLPAVKTVHGSVTK